MQAVGRDALDSLSDHLHRDFARGFFRLGLRREIGVGPDSLMREDAGHMHRIRGRPMDGQVCGPTLAAGQRDAGALDFVFRYLLDFHCALPGRDSKACVMADAISNTAIMEVTVPVYEHTRSTGKRLTYTIEYTDGEYFIHQDGKPRKAVPDSLMIGIVPHEAKADLMLRTAIADIESLTGMDE
jgi:hypothetical protein